MEKNIINYEALHRHVEELLVLKNENKLNFATVNKVLQNLINLHSGGCIDLRKEKEEPQVLPYNLLSELGKAERMASVIKILAESGIKDEGRLITLAYKIVKPQ